VGRVGPATLEGIDGLIVELLQNIAVLVALAFGLQVLGRRYPTDTMSYRVLAGLVFGAAGVIGMMTPLMFAPGVFYDGRSIVLALAGMFGGPAPAALAAVICATYRAALGGAGATVGVLVIFEASLLGLALYALRRRDERWAGALRLWLGGIVIHVGMLAIQLGLPEGMGWAAIRQVGPVVMTFFPLGFVLVGKTFLQAERTARMEAALQETQAQQRAMIACSPLALYSIDNDGNVLSWNESAERLFGWRADEVLGRPLPIVPEVPTPEFEEFRRRVLSGEAIIGAEVVRRRKDGSTFHGSLATAPLVDEDGRRFGIFGAMKDITDRKLIEETLRSSEARFRALVEGAPDGIFVQIDGKFAYVNDAAGEMYGADPAEMLLGTSIIDRVHPDFRDRVRERIEGLNERQEAKPALEQVHLRLDGAEFPVEVSGVPTQFDGKHGAIVFVRDISARKDMEQKLAQSQKMAAVGRLAGGVAHDFNNMLQTISGYAELLLDSLPDGQEQRGHVIQVQKAAARSADLTRQLLAFARRQVVAPRRIDLNACVSDLLKMLERLIGEDISLLWKPTQDECPVLLDPSQIDQILANLVVNARDAIPGVGRITIETDHRRFDAEYCRDHPGFIEGEFEMVAVSDDGVGMDKATLEKVFEPFFTTKGLNEGTGFGLATVYGIVKQNGGFINVYSEPDRGTTFRIYLPRAEASVAAHVPEAAPAAIPSGSETVLLVEDEPALRDLGQTLVSRLGYEVLVAGDPAEAIALVRQGDRRIDVLLTDVIMPGMTGRDLYDELRGILPDLRCLYMSGYTDNVIAHHGVLDEGVHFLQKPFSSADLACRLREALGA
jgi:two-component system cell cycle sensor histidine kinase/response regulator CckA